MLIKLQDEPLIRIQTFYREWIIQGESPEVQVVLHDGWSPVTGDLLLSDLDRFNYDFVVLDSALAKIFDKDDPRDLPASFQAQAICDEGKRNGELNNIERVRILSASNIMSIFGEFSAGDPNTIMRATYVNDAFEILCNDCPNFSLVTPVGSSVDEMKILMENHLEQYTHTQQESTRVQDRNKLREALAKRFPNDQFQMEFPFGSPRPDVFCVDCNHHQVLMSERWPNTWDKLCTIFTQHIASNVHIKYAEGKQKNATPQEQWDLDKSPGPEAQPHPEVVVETVRSALCEMSVRHPGLVDVKAWGGFGDIKVTCSQCSAVLKVGGKDIGKCLEDAERHIKNHNSKHQVVFNQMTDTSTSLEVNTVQALNDPNQTLDMSGSLASRDCVPTPSQDHSITEDYGSAIEDGYSASITSPEAWRALLEKLGLVLDQNLKVSTRTTEPTCI